MKENTKAYLQIHTAVFLFGFTAILGKAITLPETTIVWWRMMLTTFSLFLLPGILKKLRTIPRRSLLKLVGIGTIVAFHWIFFFGGVKFSNVSVTLSCIATASFFTSILEPLILGTRFKWYEIALGLLIVPGVYLIFTFTEFYAIGIGMSLLSAFLAALFSVLNKRMVDQFDSISITVVELGSGWLAITPLIFIYYQFFPEKPFLPADGYDVLYLCILAFLCTSFAYVITLKALKVLSSFSINLTINLEPVYGIVLAWLIFQENQELEGGFYIGAAIILVAVFIHPLIERALNKKKAAG